MGVEETTVGGCAGSRDGGVISAEINAVRFVDTHLIFNLSQAEEPEFLFGPRFAANPKGYLF